jgi:putative ABC transport system substrate-binding protein
MDKTFWSRYSDYSDNRKSKIQNLKSVGLTVIAVTLLACGGIAEAQQAKVAKVGLLSSTFPASFRPYQAMFDELRKLGYSEGQNLVFEFRTAEGNADRLPELAAELIRAKVGLLIAPGPEATLKAAKQASATIPIVMVAIDYDPIARGYITGLARPGGNITGLFFRQLELGTKRIELLKETLPEVSRIAVFWDRFSADQLKDIEITARSLGVRLQPVEVGNPTYDFESAFKVIAQARAGALLLLASPVFHRERQRIAELAVKNRLPTMAGAREHVEAGGFMTYGVNLSDMYRRAAFYVDKVLRGIKPADLPVEQPTKFEFFINLKTAKQIGITIRQSVLFRADKVVK